MNKIARIHQALTGRYHVSDEALPYLHEIGAGYKSRREALYQAKQLGFSHYLDPNNRPRKFTQ